MSKSVFVGEKKARERNTVLFANILKIIVQGVVVDSPQHPEV
jgi:hypothetical protein